MTTTTRPNSGLKRGDVVLVLFPHTDLRSAKLRPAVVVQADNLGTGLPQIILAMITSRLSRANHPSRVTIRVGSSEGRRSGLLTDSVVVTDNLATVRESEVNRVVGSLPMEEVNVALKHTLGL